MTTDPSLPVAQAEPGAADAAGAPASTSTPSTDRPTDEAILKQVNDIRAEGAAAPYVGDREGMDALRQEYAAGSQVFQHKVDKLAQSYGALRRTRGDGNCFLRAFIFAYLEHLLLTQDTSTCTKFASALQGLKGTLVAFGFQELVFEDALDLLLQHISGIQEGLLSVEALEGAYRDDMASNLVVMLLRLITSAEIQRREDFFLPFILGLYDEPVEMFCQRHVEPMAEESDNITIVALTDALQVPVRVVYLDRSGAAEFEAGGAGSGGSELDVNHHDFIPDACAATTAQPAVHLLYRPGHYDILYARQDSGH